MPAQLKVALSTEDHRWLLEQMAGFWITAHRREWLGEHSSLRPWPREEYRLAYEALARRPVPSSDRISELRARFQQSWADFNQAKSRLPQGVPLRGRVGISMEPMRRYDDVEAEVIRGMVEPAVIPHRSTIELDRHVHGMLVDWLQRTWLEFERRCASPSEHEIDRLHEHGDRMMRDTTARLILLLTGHPVGGVP